MTSIYHKMAAAEPEVRLSQVEIARIKIPKVFTGFLRTPDSMEVVSTQSRGYGHHFWEMSAVKPEVSVTLLVGMIKTKFQRRFWGFQRCMTQRKWCRQSRGRKHHFR
jgi:hypothetical protein